MSPIGWIAVGIAAALLADLTVVGLRQRGRAGKRLALPRIRFRIPPLVPPMLLLAGAVAVFLGQSLQLPDPTTADQVTRWLTLFGVLAFAAGGAMFRSSLGTTKSSFDAPTASAHPPESRRRPSRMTGKQPRSARSGRSATPKAELAALLLVAVALLFLGSSMTSYLPEDLRLWSYA